ncbi:MAG: CHAP domain-containing protein [Patescibacteria group bacterium]|nr:CHAP domain-containing protein [Patescibacteria group bacterium]
MNTKTKNNLRELAHNLYSYLANHVGIFAITLVVLLANLFIARANASYVANLNYLEPSSASVALENIDKFTPNISENAQDVKSTLAIAESEEYVKQSESLTTEGTKLEQEYVVQKGDTMTTIAQKFNLHVATILDRNNIDVNSVESLKTGQTLIIPSKDTSDSQDWLAQLNAKKEQERKLAEQKRQQQLAAARAVATRNSASSRTATSTKGAKLAEYSGNNSYPYGWCTWYAASRRSVPGNWGNAGSWLRSAQNSGYATGSEPQSGAIIVTNESWVGHVGYVESVNGDQVTISEMNYRGWGVVSSRTINAGSGAIKGYIY